MAFRHGIGGRGRKELGILGDQRSCRVATALGIWLGICAFSEPADPAVFRASLGVSRWLIR